MKLSYLFNKMIVLLLGIGLFMSLASCSSSGGSETLSAYTLSGTVTGLTSGSKFALFDNINNISVVISANGPFQFSRQLNSGSNYNVVISIQPSNQICSVVNGQGVNINHNISNISVVCSSTGYSIGGNVIGLNSGESVELVNNGDTRDDLVINATGKFSFSKTVASQGSYDVTIATQPLNEVCTVNYGQGINVSQNITSIVVICSSTAYSLGGVVSGLNLGQDLAIVNNGDYAHALVIESNNSFSFTTPLAAGGNYNVTIETQPTDEICTVVNGQGVNVKHNITNISIICSGTSYPIGGTVSGLTTGENVTLVNNGNLQEALVLESSNSFTFLLPVAAGSGYNVVIQTQPANEICSVSNGRNINVNQNITNIVVTCSNSFYTIGGSVSGLDAGEDVTLLNNDNPNDHITMASNSSFTFASPVPFMGSYKVTIGSQPRNESCTVNNSQGENIQESVSDVSVVCSPDTYTIGGTLTGLPLGESVTLVNGGDTALSTTLTKDGEFTLSQNVVFQGSYNVTIGTQPATYTCSVQNGYGTNVTSNIDTIAVFCNKDIIPVEVTASGYFGSGVTVINNHDHSDPLYFNSAGIQSFARKIPESGNFFITIANEPANVICNIVPQQGSDVTQSEVSIQITCINTNSLVYAGYSMAGGITPHAGLTLDNNGNIYGTTISGGGSNNGTIFQFANSIVTTLYSFNGGTSDGCNPMASLMFDSNNQTFYGTTYACGENNKGSVFSFKNGVERIIYSFGSKSNDGTNPIGGVILGDDGNLYGATAFGGSNGGGTVFMLTTNGAETILHDFGSSNADGTTPQSGLILGNDGNFYGTTAFGGTHAQGTVFTITISGNESVLHSFGSYTGDGISPKASLVQGYDGNLYGTTYNGGNGSCPSGCGTVFKLSPQGVEKTLYSFGSSIADGSYPQSNLVADYNGSYYGTTTSDLAYNAGTIFKISSSGVENILYHFGSLLVNGSNPKAGIIIDSHGNIYGTTSSGTDYYNNGSIFELKF